VTIDAARKRNRQVGTELAAHAAHKVHRQDVQGCPREIALALAAGHEVAIVFDHERVAELDAESHTERSRVCAETFDETARLVP
jgi:hypothetical protein